MNENCCTLTDQDVDREIQLFRERATPGTVLLRETRWHTDRFYWATVQEAVQLCRGTTAWTEYERK